MIVESVFCSAVFRLCTAFVEKRSEIIHNDNEIPTQMISVSFPIVLCNKLLLKSFVQRRNTEF